MLDVEFDAKDASIQGKDKSDNEDKHSINKDKGIYVIADGMSGWNGKEASSTAVKIVSETLESRLNNKPSEEQIEKLMIEAMRQANEQVFSLGEKSGTTLDVVVIANEQMHFAHIGDSKIYVMTDGNEVEQVTEDHVQPQSVYQGGEPKDELEKKILSIANMYMPAKWLGREMSLAPEDIQIGKRELKDVKRILMATDGLTDLATDQDIKRELSEEYLENVSTGLMGVVKSPIRISQLYVDKLDKFDYRTQAVLLRKSVIPALKEFFKNSKNDPKVGEQVAEMERDYYNNPRLEVDYKDFLLKYFEKNSVGCYSAISVLFFQNMARELSLIDDATYIIIEPQIEEGPAKEVSIEKPKVDVGETEEYQSLLRELGEVRTDREKLYQQNKLLQTQLEGKEKEISDLRRGYASLETRVSSLEEERERQSVDEKRIREEAIEEYKQSGLYKEELDRKVQEAVRVYEERINSLENEVKQFKEGAQKQIEELVSEKYDEERRKKDEEISTLKTERDGLYEKVSRLEEEKENFRREALRREEELKRVSSEYEQYKSNQQSGLVQIREELKDAKESCSTKLQRIEDKVSRLLEEEVKETPSDLKIEEKEPKKTEEEKSLMGQLYDVTTKKREQLSLYQRVKRSIKKKVLPLVLVGGIFLGGLAGGYFWGSYNKGLELENARTQYEQTISRKDQRIGVLEDYLTEREGEIKSSQESIAGYEQRINETREQYEKRLVEKDRRIGNLEEQLKKITPSPQEVKKDSELEYLNKIINRSDYNEQIEVITGGRGNYLPHEETLLPVIHNPDGSFYAFLIGDIDNISVQGTKLSEKDVYLRYLNPKTGESIIVKPGKKVSFGRDMSNSELQVQAVYDVREGDNNQLYMKQFASFVFNKGK